MPSQGDPWLSLLDRLDAHLSGVRSAAKGADAAADRKARTKELGKALEDVCAVVRDAERRRAPGLDAIVERASEVLDGALRGAPSALPTFAHSEDEPLVEDALEYAGSDILDAFVKFYSSLLKPGAPQPKLPAFARIRPWSKSPRPHPLSTRLSRFRGGFAPSATGATPLANTIYEARAQLTVDMLSSVPFDMALSSSGSILASTGGGGWKGRDPFLHYYNLGDQSSDYLEGVTMDPGLSNVARYITTDDSHKLIFLADDDRIKSFSFAHGPSGKLPKRLPNVHTMNSQRTFNGPMISLPNGRIARTGKGKVAVWNLDELETHQDNPGKLIGGRKLSLDNSARPEGCEDIEMSSGSSPHATITFADNPSCMPAVLHFHQPTGYVLYAERAGGSHTCSAVDLEHGGKRVARFLGHGGAVERAASSTGDPRVFVTAGADGYARLYDVRRPLPVLTFNTGMQREACADVVLVHPDGIPTLFTGGELTHQVKMWDIRAEECVYELATGNNAVVALAWDDTRASLFVATQCANVNRLGVRTGYRRARVPRWASYSAVDREYRAGRAGGDAPFGAPRGMDYPDLYDAYLSDGEEGEESEDEDDELDIDEAYSADMRWPQKCFHKEDFFGYAYDAGEHVLFRWQFKDSPDISQLPASTTID